MLIRDVKVDLGARVTQFRLWVSSLEGSKVVFPLFDSPTRENSEHIENAQNREGYYC